MNVYADINYKKQAPIEAGSKKNSEDIWLDSSQRSDTDSVGIYLNSNTGCTKFCKG